jgi:hypothetical protein
MGVRKADEGKSSAMGLPQCYFCDRLSDLRCVHSSHAQKL